MHDQFLVIVTPSGYSILAPFGAPVFGHADKSVCARKCAALNADPPDYDRLLEMIAEADAPSPAG